MSYAYLDQYGILHIVDRKEDAEKYASGEIVETDIPNGGGYPEVDGKHIIVYVKDDKYKVNGTEYPLDTNFMKKYPDIMALVNELK